MNGASPLFSIVMCSTDDVRFLGAEAHWRQVMCDTCYQLIRVRDARSMCEGYNRGFAQARGEFIVFCHDDVELLGAGAPVRLKAALEELDVVGLAGTDRLVSSKWGDAGEKHAFGIVAHPARRAKRRGILERVTNVFRGQHDLGQYSISVYGAPSRTVAGMQALDGLFIACRREVAENLPWDAANFPAFFLYDLDWTFRAFQMGMRLGVIVDMPVFHASRGDYSSVAWKRSAEAFVRKHKGLLDQSLVRRHLVHTVDVNSKARIVQVVESICAKLDSGQDAPEGTFSAFRSV